MPPSDEQRTEDRSRRATAPSQRATPPGNAAVPAEPAVQQRAVAAFLVALLSLTGVLALGAPQRGVFLVGYALLAGVVAMWLAVTALARARRGRTTRPRGSIIATVIAGVGIILSVIMLIAFAVFGKQLTTYGRCLSLASTSADRQACQTQFIHAVNRELTTLQKTSPR